MKTPKFFEWRARYGLHPDVGKDDAEDLLGALPLRLDSTPSEDVLWRRRNLIFRYRLKNGETVVVKQWRFCGILSGLRMSFRGTKAERSFRAALMLDGMGVSTPRPILWWWRRSGLLRADAAYVCIEKTGSAQIRALQGGRVYAPGNYSSMMRRRAEHLRAAGSIAGRLHEAGLMHHDYTAGNILLEQLASGEWRYNLVDLNRVRRHRSISPARGIRNLARLEFGEPEDVDELLGAYCAERGMSVEHARPLYFSYLRRRMRIIFLKERTYRIRHPLVARRLSGRG